MNFELNGKTYTTDAETLNVLRSIMPSAKSTGDSTAVQAVMYMGLHTNRIVDVSDYLELIRLLLNYLPVDTEKVRSLVEKMGGENDRHVRAASHYCYMAGYHRSQTTPEKFLESFEIGEG